MNGPHCRSGETKVLAKKTDLGYALFRCRGCRRTFNERTGTEFNFLEMPPGIVFRVVLFRLLFKLSLRIPLLSLEVRIWWGKSCADHTREPVSGPPVPGSNPHGGAGISAVFVGV